MPLEFITPYSVRLGVAGAGTMGSGIALSILLAGMPVTLYDPSPEMLERGKSYIEKQLERKSKSDYLPLLTLCGDLAGLGSAQVVIEAAPEDLTIKRDLFTSLEGLTQPDAILATNTSTLSVTAIAADVQQPARVAGLHFFNPAAVMPLVEVVRGAQTSPDAITSLVSLVEKIGKTPIVVSDRPGFIVNRVARPFYGEGLRLLAERAASHEAIDQIIKLGGGFRMGPFELMDLIGIDVNFSATRSMYEQSFGEPRYQPSWIQAQMVQQNALGRKTGRGFYEYGSAAQAAEPVAPPLRKQSGHIRYVPGGWAPGMAELMRQAGYTFSDTGRLVPSAPTMAVVAAGRLNGMQKQLIALDQALPQHVPILCQCCDVTVTEIASWLEYPERLVGFDGLFFCRGQAATLVASPTLNRRTHQAASAFVRGLGRLDYWIEDSPALVLPRVVCMLANEAAFALLEEVAEADKIDLAMKLGANYPLGPLAWAKELGYSHVVTVLDHLFDEYHEERYRAALLLRRWARLEDVTA